MGAKCNAKTCHRLISHAQKYWGRIHSLKKGVEGEKSATQRAQSWLAMAVKRREMPSILLQYLSKVFVFVEASSSNNFKK